MPDAYPLAWPPGWPRTPLHRRADGRMKFRRTTYGRSEHWTFDEARRALADELDRHAAIHVVLSSNRPLRLDGQPRAGTARPEDDGVALYFTRAGRTLAMACDRYERAEDNMRSLTLALEAMRQLERHGGGIMVDRAFDGFTALPAPEAGRHWRDILGFGGAQVVTAGDIRAAWRGRIRKARETNDEAAEVVLNVARDEALKEIANG